MKDQYGRIIDYMRISITDRCNLRCRYCMPEGVELVPMKNILSYEEIEMVCQAAAKAGIRKFKITGGEPLVRLGSPELIGKIKKIPGVEQVTMTTNGVLLSKYLPELLKNGLDAVNISLDTLDRERYQVITGRDELFRVLESVDQAVDAGIPVKINSVLQKGMNEDEFLALARLTLEKKLDVRFIEMMPIGLGKKYETIYNEDILSKDIVGTGESSLATNEATGLNYRNEIIFKFFPISKFILSAVTLAPANVASSLVVSWKVPPALIIVLS